MTRGEHYAALDQLRPGDVIVWTSGGQAEERELIAAWKMGDGDWWHLDWLDGGCADVNASVLVRRTRQAVQ